MEFISIESISGFFTGFGLMVLLAIYLWRKGKKERKFDERYETVHERARTFSWGVTIVFIFILFIGIVIYEGFGLAAISLAIVYAFILLTYFGATTYFNKKI